MRLLSRDLAACCWGSLCTADGGLFRLTVSCKGYGTQVMVSKRGKGNRKARKRRKWRACQAGASYRVAKWLTLRPAWPMSHCHCEEQSDEAMTVWVKLYRAWYQT